jgi:hypothetical protein
LHDSKEIELFDKVFAIQFAKNVPHKDYTRYDQISLDHGGDQIRDVERSEK